MQMLRGQRILVVEDEALIAMYVVDALADAGAVAVGPAVTVANALAILAQDTNFDAAVLDLKLAGEPSEPVAMVLVDHGVPYVIITGYSSGSMPMAEWWADDTLMKPFTAIDLVMKLAAIGGRSPSWLAG